MKTLENYLGDLPKIADDMRELRRSQRAVVRYELLSDSLVWSDESPKSADLDLDCLRFVFRYRTSLILGEPDAPYEIFWNEARRFFPEWIGFALERTSQNAELADFYSREKERALHQMDPV